MNGQTCVRVFLFLPSKTSSCNNDLPLPFRFNVLYLAIRHVHRNFEKVKKHKIRDYTIPCVFNSMSNINCFLCVKNNANNNIVLFGKQPRCIQVTDNIPRHEVHYSVSEIHQNRYPIACEAQKISC